MKKYLIALSAFTIITISVNAQEKRTTAGEAPMAHHNKMDHKKMGHGGQDRGAMMKELNLTNAQKQQAMAIRKDYANQMKQLDGDGSSMSINDYNAKKAALQNEQKARFESLLIKEQKNKMQELKKDQAAKGEKMGEKRMDKMKTTLNLTDAQVAKLKNQHDNFKSQAEAIKANTSLSQDEKKQQFMELKKKKEESEKNILTAEQLQRKEQMRSSRMKDMKNKRTEKS
ncbi:MAG: hypothetical protein ABIN25_05395 [Ginsengibacter sp.]